MANINAQIVAQIKNKLTELRAQVAKYEAALSAFGVSGGAGATGKASGKKSGGSRSGYKPVAAIQAAGDARAVKAGTATPEQTARYNERQAQKALKASAKSASTDTASETEVVSGGSLAAAAS